MKIKAIEKPVSTLLFFGAMFLSSVCEPKTDLTLKLEPLSVMEVRESTALGYGNGRKLISTPDGTMYFSAVSIAPNGSPGVCVIRTVRNASGAQPTFQKVWIENSNGITVSDNMHFASSLGAYGAGPFYVVWTGAEQANSDDPKLAHQLRFAKINTASTMTVAEAAQPITVTGFSEAYRPPYRSYHLWQEFPSAFVSKDGKMHVVWEARDKNHKSPQGVPIPAIAYAVRDEAGSWSVKGEIETPPYLDIKSAGGGQYRPFMVTDSSDTMHVVCYGASTNRFQILYGNLANGKFSGWESIASSQNDQRHVTVAIDAQGRLHAVWREGGLANKQSFIVYSMRDLDGKWLPTIKVDDPYRSGSTPNVTVDDNAVYVVWTSWEEGFENSDSQKNNNFPNDNDTVEGRLEFAYKKFDGESFTTPVLLTGGTGAYPRVARMKNTNPGKLAVIWALGKECLPHSCIQIYFSELATPQ